MRLNFKTYGNGEPLVILHGLFGSLNNWQTMGRRLGEQFEVIAVDQRNHGHSPHSDAMDYSLMAGDLIELLDELHITSAHLLGHSMGGKTSMQCALSYPSRVRTLIVVDIAPRAYTESHDPILDALLALPLETLSTREEADEALARDVVDPAVRAFLLTNLKRDENGSLAWKMNLPVLKKHYRALIDAVRLDRTFSGPTLFLVGGKSHYVTGEDQPLIRQLFPNSVTIRLEQAGHWVHVEATEAMFEAVTGFLLKGNHG